MTEFYGDLKKFDVPTLVIHGEDDQVVPFKNAGPKSAKLIKNAKFIPYPGAPHGITATHQDEINKQLLDFIKGVPAKAPRAASSRPSSSQTKMRAHEPIPG